jgi:RNA polymerase-interacting CarD/CdnL/TRCF family regulator
MDFQIGDKVIHSTYGLGVITRIEEKPIQNETCLCYVFQTDDLQLWIPVDKVDQHRLHPPMPAEEFKQLFAILKSPPARLDEDRGKRVKYLVERAREDDLVSLCQLVRDLSYFKRDNKLSEQERFILSRTEKTLLSEWSYAMNVSLGQAYRRLARLLAEGANGSPGDGRMKNQDTRPLTQVNTD